MLAAVDLYGEDPNQSVEQALGVATGLRGDLTLLSVVESRRFSNGGRRLWPASAFGKGHPEIDIHRVTLPGSPPETIAKYADQIRADLLLVPAQYRVRRRWLRKVPLPASVAALSSRLLLTAPVESGAWIERKAPRIACLMRLNGTDDRLFAAARAMVQRRGGDLYLVYQNEPARWMDRNSCLDAMRHAARSLGVPWTPLMIESRGKDALLAAAQEHGFSCLIAGRTMFVESTKSSGDLLAFANHLPCPLLSVPITSAYTEFYPALP